MNLYVVLITCATVFAKCVCHICTILIANEFSINFVYVSVTLNAGKPWKEVGPSKSGI